MTVSSPFSQHWGGSHAAQDILPFFHQKKGLVKPETRQGVLTRSLSPMPPLTGSSHDTAQSPCSCVNQEIECLDVVFNERSSQSVGMRHLKMLQCVKLLIGSEVTVVVPPSSAQSKSPKAACKPRRRTIEDFYRVISETALPGPRFGTQRKSSVAKEQQKRTIL